MTSAMKPGKGILKNLTVGQKIGLAFCSIVIVSMIGSAISLWNFFALRQAVDWNTHTYEVLGASDVVVGSMVDIETGLRGYVASGESNFLEPFDKGAKTFLEATANLKQLTSDNPAQQERIATLSDLRNKIGVVDNDLISLRKDVSAGAKPLSALSDYFKVGHDKEFMDKFRAVINDLQNAERSLLVERTARMQDLTTSTEWTLALSGMLTVLLSVGLGYVITRNLIRTLGGEPLAAAGVAELIAQGRLDTAITLRSDDTTSLMFSLERMRQQLNAIVGSIKVSSESISVASGQIAQGNTDLAQRTEEQAASLEETAASMEQLTATVRMNEGNAQEGNRLAASVSQIAIRGGQEVRKVVDTMSDIANSSSKVAQIISVIEGIAFQTNILALNAAVEAARAGEQGRGFAVVAGEVRGLAQRSASAAKEIKDLIGQSADRVDVGNKLVSAAGSTIDEVVQAVQRMTSLMSEIAAASAEQTTGIEQVNQAVGQMDEVTQQNAALVEEASAAAQAMAEQAVSLAAVVGVFQLDAWLRVIRISRVAR